MYQDPPKLSLLYQYAVKISKLPCQHMFLWSTAHAIAPPHGANRTFFPVKVLKHPPSEFLSIALQRGVCRCNYVAASYNKKVLGKEKADQKKKKKFCTYLQRPLPLPIREQRAPVVLDWYLYVFSFLFRCMRCLLQIILPSFIRVLMMAPSCDTLYAMLSVNKGKVQYSQKATTLPLVWSWSVLRNLFIIRLTTMHKSDF